MTIAELRARRGKAIGEARKIYAAAEKDPKGKRGLTAEEREQFDKWMKDANEAKGLLDVAEADEKRRSDLEGAELELEESAGRAAGGSDPDEDDDEEDEPARRGEQPRGRSARHEPRSIRWKLPSGRSREVVLEGRTSSAEYRRSYAKYLSIGQRQGLVSKEGEREGRDLQADSDVDGGYLVAPVQMAAGLIKFVDDLVFMRQFGTVIPVTKAQSLGATSLDSDPDDGEWTSEVNTGTADTGMKLGGRELNPTQLSKEVKISRKLLRLAPDVEGLVRDRLGYKFAITEEKQFLLGDGANKPLGVFVASSNGISTGRDSSTSNTATAITADGLIRAKMKLKAQYRNRARWLFHRDAVTQIMLLKDGNGQYLWRQGLTGGDPDTLLNLPVAESEYAPNTFTTGKYVGMLADFSYYWIAEALGLEIQRLDELYAKQNKVGFIGRMELDGQPVLEEAFVRVQLG